MGIKKKIDLFLFLRLSCRRRMKKKNDESIFEHKKKINQILYKMKQKQKKPKQ